MSIPAQAHSCRRLHRSVTVHALISIHCFSLLTVILFSRRCSQQKFWGDKLLGLTCKLGGAWTWDQQIVGSNLTRGKAV